VKILCHKITATFQRTQKKRGTIWGTTQQFSMINHLVKALFQFLMMLFCCSNLVAQNSFKPEMMKLNPVQIDNEIGTSSSIKRHETFLQNAIETQNELHQLYGLIYLYKDYFKQTDFVTSSKYLLQAEKLAKTSGKPGWIGIVNGYRAALTSTIENNPTLTIKQFEEAIANCSKAKDSLCIGESYEQISTEYNHLRDYKKAHYYFNLSLPLLKKFGTDRNLAAAYNNYSTVLINEKNFKEALVFIEKAIAIAVEKKLLHSEMVFRSNLAATYMDLNELDKALKIIDFCEPINLKNNYQDNLVSNYICRSIIYEKKGDYKRALEYQYKYREQKDKIAGENVLSKISNLEESARRKENELLLKKKEVDLLKSKQLIQNYSWLFLILISAISVGIWLWRKEVRLHKKQDLENRKNLAVLTNLLIEKNNLLLEKDEEMSEQNETEESSFASEPYEIASYNKRILTNSDWQSFKDYFEKVHPNFNAKLRKEFPTITESEERLFLLVKLNLRTKEIASILGISNDSVKKNRNRLRKRLSLNADQDLVEYVHNF
jgi:DNA-binding CsgD family transcriptional regulator